MPRTSSKRTEVLEYIKTFTTDNGYPPSVREICRAVGLKSPSSVHTHIANLVKEGLLRKDSYKTRALVLNEESKVETTSLPLVGKVTAGQPILAVENIEEFFPVPAHFFTMDENAFMLRVSGESMINAGIHDGDYIIVRQQESAQNGDIVVALLDDSATVKRFYRETDRIRLQPENPAMAPIYARDVKILGLVVGLVRKFN